MSSPNISGGPDTLAFTGVGPGTLILAVVGITLTVLGWIANKFSKQMEDAATPSA